LLGAVLDGRFCSKSGTELSEFDDELRYLQFFFERILCLKKEKSTFQFLGKRISRHLFIFLQMTGLLDLLGEPSLSSHDILSFFCLFLFEGTFTSFVKDKKSYRSHNTV
jgi:hypothetical protein